MTACRNRLPFTEARRVIDPYLVRAADGSISGVRAGDGDAAVYGLDHGGGFMITHASGFQIWSLLVDAARAANFAIIPIGCPVCVANRSLLDHLPPEMAEGARGVENGEELLLVVQSS